ncbi:MAG: prolyl-tRNA editing protein, partial [Phototrophicales bacterium]
ALQSLGLSIQIQTFSSSTRTAQEAADAIGTPLGSIAKSIVFRIVDQIIVVITAGDHRVSDRKLATLFDVSRKKIKIASAEQCIKIVGYAPGGVPPLGHRTKVPIYIDQTLARFNIVYGAAGSPYTIFPIEFKTLVKITEGIVADVASPIES